MSERDRMLAEGPRVAPEPRTAGTTAGPVSDRPVVPTGRPSPSFPFSLVRLMPLAVLALFLLASFTGLGRFAWILFVALGVLTAVLRRRKARG
jgi:hypothetical protein